MEQPVREVLFFGTYFGEFYQKQPERARRKIDQVFFLVAHSLLVPEKFLK